VCERFNDRTVNVKPRMRGVSWCYSSSPSLWRGRLEPPPPPGLEFKSRAGQSYTAMQMVRYAPLQHLYVSVDCLGAIRGVFEK